MAKVRPKGVPKPNAKSKPKGGDTPSHACSSPVLQAGYAKSKPEGGDTPSEVLRAEIASLGLTAYAVGKRSGVDVSILQRFLTGERMLSLGSFDKVCVALRLRLQPDRES